MIMDIQNLNSTFHEGVISGEIIYLFFKFDIVKQMKGRASADIMDIQNLNSTFHEG